MRRARARNLLGCLIVAAGPSFPPNAMADENGISFWLPGIFGSLIAAPQTPGWSLTSMYYHTTVAAGANVARSREITIGQFPIGLTASVDAEVRSKADIALMIPTYTFATPFLGGQASLGLMAIYGRNSTSLAGTLNGTLTGPGGGVLPFSRVDSFYDSLTGYGDLYPQFFVRWNQGVHNYMTYVTGDIPVGAYEPARLSNMGIGHGAIDGGVGYTYFNPETGHEFSAVFGATYNFKNYHTDYQNGIDTHLDWGWSQFLSKQVMVGLVGYVYKQATCDSGSGDRVGCFLSQVIGVGPQIGFIIPVGTTTQAYLNLKSYKEFEAENRPRGWNTWVSLTLSPASAPPPPPRRMVTK
jgi:hypothetical protein